MSGKSIRPYVGGRRARLAVLAVIVGLTGLMGLVADAGPASAQTRFSVTGGAIIPWGGFADAVDPSPAVGARVEFQPVNVIGQRRLLALVLDATVGLLDEAALPAVGGTPPADVDSDASLLAFGGGIRAYSRVAPFFVSGGVGWARYDAAQVSAEHGVDLHAGLGFLVPTGSVILEVEVALHEMVFSRNDLQYLSASAALALPI